ncbi:hypothetical protein ECC02_006865 [Trypanosoma cruzi]|uniref:Uncharacterized protein n=1 Tax=Trypanosoma cruzi TaxID=5693 RepID=A0A7J6Y063_TRYCR|nr:hypothetical protein ECC02_006865 [Trypanosoma cruzi]
MSTAVSVMTTWAAEHSLKIEAEGNGAALFRIASNRNSDEDAADHRLGGGNPRVNSHLVLLPGNAIDRQLNFVLHFTPTAGQTVPRRRQPRLGAGAGASQHTMRSLLAGCVHTALHHGGEATAPCPAPTHLHSLGVRHRDSCTASLGPRASTKDTSVHTAASSAPLRTIIGFRAPTQHERLTRLRYIEDVRGAICSETMSPLSILGKAATTISLPGDAVLNGLRRVCFQMGISPDRIRAPHAAPRVVFWGTVSRNEVGVFQPRHARDALDGVRRSAVEAACASLGPCMWICCAASRLPGQRSSLWGLTAQLLAALHDPAERSVLPPSMATDSSPPGSSVPIAHTSSFRHRCPVGDGGTMP